MLRDPTLFYYTMHTYIRTYIHTYRQTDRQTDVSMYVCLYVCMFVCICIYIYVSIYAVNTYSIYIYTYNFIYGLDGDIRTHYSGPLYEFEGSKRKVNTLRVGQARSFPLSPRIHNLGNPTPTSSGFLG